MVNGRGPGREDPGGILGTLLSGPEGAPPGGAPAGWSGLTPEMESWWELVAGNPDAGYVAWRERMAEGLSDAPAGRLEIAPRLPRHLNSFRAEGIGVGDVRLSLGYRREQGAHRFELHPTAGRVPANVVLAPSIPVHEAAKVLVDGREADLEVLGDGPGRLRVSVQLPLDGLRSLSVGGD